MRNITVSASRLVDSLSPETIEYVKRRLLSRIQARKLKSIEKYQKADVYRLGDDEAGYYVLVEKEEIVYFVRYRVVRHNKFRLGRQILVWRDKSSPSAAGFAHHVFLNKLLPKYHALVADQEQTEKGMEFWQYEARQSFKEGRFVYVLDRRSTPNKLVPLSEFTDVIDYQYELWGHEPGHKRVLLVISDHELNLNPA
jgi:hypothetical protein